MSPYDKFSDHSGPRARRGGDHEAAPHRKPGAGTGPRSRREDRDGQGPGERHSGKGRAPERAYGQDQTRRGPRKPGGKPEDRPDSRPDGRSEGRPDGGRRPFRKAEGPLPAGERAWRPEGQRDGRFQPRSPWPASAPLFAPLTPEARRILELLPEALDKVWPLHAAHRRSLPEDVERLSRLLTTERAGLARPYWSSPASISAYLYYFLPWNLVRLTRLLAALPLPDPRAAAPQNGEALLVDVGSGPLTLPLALWLARPQWRSAPVQVLALDTSSQPLELGRALMEALGALTGQPVWPVRTARAPLNQAARQAAPLLAGGRARPWLVSAANVLNELRFGKKRARGGGALEEDDVDSPDDALDADNDAAMADGGDGEKPEGCREERLEGFLESLSPLFGHAGSGGREATDADAAVADGPALLFVEPGTRLGGTTIMRLRQLAVDGGLTALAPCTHQHDCPLLRGQGGRTWCHFTFGSEGAPQWLEALSFDAGLGKSGLSLSPLLLAALPEGQSSGLPAASAVAGTGAEVAARSALPLRVLSAPFDVPGLVGRARYACSGKGLLLLENAEALASGDALAVPVPAGARRDRKSGALLASPPARDGEGARRAVQEKPAYGRASRQQADHAPHDRDRTGRDQRKRDEAGRDQTGRDQADRGQKRRGQPDRERRDQGNPDQDGTVKREPSNRGARPDRAKRDANRDAKRDAHHDAQRDGRHDAGHDAQRHDRDNPARRDGQAKRDRRGKPSGGGATARGKSRAGR